MIESAADSDRSTFDVIDWVFRAGIAALFADVGFEKVLPGSGSYWLTLFDSLGFGRWFMYATGAIQITGALLVLIPRTSLVGAALLAATMAGAILCHLFLLPTGVGGAVIPAGILAFVMAGARRWSRPKATSQPLSLR